MRFQRTKGRDAAPAPAPYAVSFSDRLAPGGELATALADGDPSADSLVAEIDRLVGRREGDHVAMRLRGLRHDAARAFVAGGGREPWPPPYADPFPGLSGELPEIDTRALDTDVLGGAVAHHGCLVLRSAFDADQIGGSIEATDRAHASREANEADGSVDAFYDPLLVEPRMKTAVLRKVVAGQGGIWLGDSPAATEQVLADLAKAGIIGAIAEHFGERPFFSLQKSTLRRSLPRHGITAWHQDGSFLTPGVRTMNAWVALTRCGGDCPVPALEVIPRRMKEILPVDGLLSPHSVSFDLVADLATTTPTMVPEFEAGDAVLFDERFLHRTHQTAGMDQTRYAIECWFFAPSHHSTSYTPLLV